MSPRCGIAAGGTDLTITGEELDIGVQMSVIVAGTMCDVTKKATKNQVSLAEGSSILSIFIGTIILVAKYLARTPQPVITTSVGPSPHLVPPLCSC